MADELVLIVDDNEKNLQLARDVLRHAGFRTIEARTGGDGVSIAVEAMPHDGHRQAASPPRTAAGLMGDF